MMLDVSNEPAGIAEQAMQLLAEVGVEHETAAQLAVATAVASRDPAWVPSEMEFRLALALHRLHRTEEAERLLNRSLPMRTGDVATCLTAPPSLFPLLRSGVLVPGRAGVWRLDGTGIQLPEHPGELDYAHLFTRLAHLIAPLWSDATAPGRLELSGWTRHARWLHRKRGDAARCCRNWRDDLAATIHRRNAARGCAAAPVVVIDEPI